MYYKGFLTNYRYYVLSFILSVTIIGLVAVPSDGASYWFARMVASKFIAIAGASLFCTMLQKWIKQGKIDELKKLYEHEY